MPKVKLIPTDIDSLLWLINFAYDGDNDLILNYQQGDRTFEECVEFNFNEIRDNMESNVFKDDMKLWSIGMEEDGERGITTIGYCVTVENEEQPHMLSSFAINSKYRSKEVLMKWLQAVEDKIGEGYYTAIWNKNTRAINFFKKNGFSDVVIPDKTYTILTKFPDNETKKKTPWQ